MSRDICSTIPMRVRRSSGQPNFGFRGVKYADDDTVANTGELGGIRRATRLLARAARRRRSVRRVPHALRVRQGGPREHAQSRPMSRGRTGGVEKVSFDGGLWPASECPRSCIYRGDVQPPYQAVVFFPGSAHSCYAIEHTNQSRDLRLGDEKRPSLHLSDLQEHLRAGRRGYDRLPRHDATCFASTSSPGRKTSGALWTISRVALTSIETGSPSWAPAGGRAWRLSILAVEPRFKAAMLLVGGFYMQRAKPEVEAINFAPRVKMPAPHAQRAF